MVLTGNTFGERADLRVESPARARQCRAATANMAGRVIADGPAYTPRTPPPPPSSYISAFPAPSREPPRTRIGGGRAAGRQGRRDRSSGSAVRVIREKLQSLPIRINYFWLGAGAVNLLFRLGTAPLAWADLNGKVCAHCTGGAGRGGGLNQTRASWALGLNQRRTRLRG